MILYQKILLPGAIPAIRNGTKDHHFLKYVFEQPIDCTCESKLEIAPNFGVHVTYPINAKIGDIEHLLIDKCAWYASLMNCNYAVMVTPGLNTLKFVNYPEYTAYIVASFIGGPTLESLIDIFPDFKQTAIYLRS
jgi:hypothetical protein